jgi:hypothetical protein
MLALSGLTVVDDAESRENPSVLREWVRAAD